MSIDWLEDWAPTDGAERAASVFRTRFDTEPEGTWSAPGRVNLIGEHTDYNGGLCLPIALPHRTYAAVRRRDDDLVRLVSAQEPTGLRTLDLADVAPGAVDGWVGYVVGVAWALRQAGHAIGGFDVAIDSCVPYGAGLSSSAALEASVAVALDAVFGLGLEGSDEGRTTLAALCVRAENEIAGAPTGGMDQAAALRAREGDALLLDCLDGSVRHVPFDLAAHDLALLVVDTRAEHALVDGQYAARRAACEAAAATLGVETLREINSDPRGLEWALDKLDDEDQVRRVRHVVTEIDRVTWFVALLDAGEVSLIGTLMNQSHASLRDDYEVSCRELDLVVDTARAAGALGARMTGGGFGGSAIALVAADEVDRVAHAVADAFADAGLRAPGFLVATASAPAS
ncbi:galactokinase [Cellulomonas fengjieae]|uniref:Galactokinase n=1 Tax=Cellulomonas fengjieae TaxID=2819978 RepID=A0ABS3SD68_9CELL|nr:galactokinase [Cellulomonas fengjieae]MBO3083698.1 galactokinase [Cellulomonas fengjieae]QVI64996.1 galactokinase [Cellulomonas fengjieae]